MLVVAASPLSLQAADSNVSAAQKSVHPVAKSLVESYVKALEANDIEAVLKCLAKNLDEYTWMTNATHQDIRDDFESNVLSHHSYAIKVDVVNITQPDPSVPTYVAELAFKMDYDTGRMQEHYEGTWYASILLIKPKPVIISLSEKKP